MITRVERVIAYLLLGSLAVIVIYPLLGLVFSSLQPAGTAESGSLLTGITPPKDPDLSNIQRVWNEGNFSTYMRTSLIVALGTIAVACPLAILAGYAFGTLNVKGGRFIFPVFLIGLILPSETLIISLYFDFRDAELLDTYWSLILPEAAFFLAFGTFWMRAFFRSLPTSLFDAARIDGANNWQFLVRVALPAGRPAVLTMIVLFFLWSWNEFLLPLVMISSNDHRTAPLALGLFQGQFETDTAGLTAAALIISIPAVLVYVLLQRQFLRGMLSGSVKA